MKIRRVLSTIILSVTLAVTSFGMPMPSYAVDTDGYDTETTLEPTEEVTEEYVDATDGEYFEDTEDTEEALFDEDGFFTGEDEALEDGESFEESYDWETLKTYMSQEDTQKRLGFSKARHEYTVVASVANSGSDEECGSKDDFYFQLIFEKGNSGAVLANEQLSSDGFRTGKKESFIIKTNRDYGNLTGVRVIPSVKKKDDIDKLRLDKIAVYETLENGVTEQWLMEDVGWIGSRDNDGSETVTLDDISYLYPITKTSTSLNLLLCIATCDSGSTKEAVPQFEGTVKAQIDYETSDGVFRSKIFDMVSAINEYNTAENGYEGIVSETNYDGRTLMISDPGRMFRPNHMDRCVISLEDVVSVSDIVLICGSSASTKLGIESICASIVQNTGKLTLNPNDEVVRNSEVTTLCMSELSGKRPAYSLDMTDNSSATVTVPFTKNEIVKNEDTGSHEVITTDDDPRLSDVMNLYVFADDSPEYNDPANYSVVGALQYTDVYGNSHQVSADAGRMSRAVDEDGSVFFYANALSCPDMAVLSRLVLASRDPSGLGYSSEGCVIDHAVVQKVRGSMVVDTWYFDVEEDISSGEKYLMPSMKYGNDFGISAQNLVVQFTSDTKKVNLKQGKKDIGFRITYRQSVSGDENAVKSAYVYLTDVSVSEIAPGKIVSIPFNESYVSEVTGISAIASGNIEAGVESAYLTVFETEDDKMETGYYSFADGFNIEKNVENSAERTSDSKEEIGSVVPLILTFTTSEFSRISGSGEYDKVALKIGYQDQLLSDREYVIDDMSDYMMAGDEDRGPGKTCRIKVLLKDAADLSFVTVIPLSYSWNVSYISFDLGDGMVVRSRIVDKVITIKGETIILNVSYEELEEAARQEEKKKQEEEEKEKEESEEGSSDDSDSNKDEGSSSEQTSLEDKTNTGSAVNTDADSSSDEQEKTDTENTEASTSVEAGQ
ncbi:MAG: hypothetical protein K6F00_03800 [Lachnospiraceae bacterium]|nr:hypothetical protein [Lachnospiraceae bacterium]